MALLEALTFTTAGRYAAALMESAGSVACTWAQRPMAAENPGSALLFKQSLVTPREAAAFYASVERGRSGCHTLARDAATGPARPRPLPPRRSRSRAECVEQSRMASEHATCLLLSGRE